MTDMNIAYIVSVAIEIKDYDSIKDTISHIRGVISVEPIVLYGNMAFLVVLDHSIREDCDTTEDAISHIEGVFNVTPIISNIDQHIAEAHISEIMSKEFSDFYHSFYTKLQDKIEVDRTLKEHKFQSFLEICDEIDAKTYANRFKCLLDIFVFSDVKTLNERQRALRRKLMEFCGEYLICWGTEYHIPEWKDEE